MQNHFDPAKTAILSLHMLNDIVSRDGKFSEFFAKQVEQRNVIGKSKEFLKAARSSNIPIYHIRVCYQPDYSDVYINNELLAVTKKMNALIDGRWGTEFIQGLEPVGNESVINHQRTNPFHGTDFLEILKNEGIENLILFGVATNYVVEGSARFAGDEGLRVYVLEDCCATATEQAHNEAINSLRLLTTIVSSEDIIQAMKSPTKTLSE
jgi:biuret amidohydrolase